MNFLRNVSSVLVSSRKPTHIREIETQLTRLETASHVSDKLAALEVLSQLSEDHKVDVGQHMAIYLKLLREEREDEEIAVAGVEFMLGLVKEKNQDFNENQDFDENYDFYENSEIEIAYEHANELKRNGKMDNKQKSAEFVNSELICSDSKNIALFVDFLEDESFELRFGVIKLLANLILHKAEKVQSSVLNYPMGVNRMVEILGDKREIIRNEMLLLLEALTATNANIQKIVVFEGLFEKLFSIVSEEGYSSGGIIVEDCLRLVDNLVRDNLSNQNYFRESGCLSRIPPLLRPSM